MDPPPTHHGLQSMMARSIQGYPEEFKLKVEVQGVYALPEEWIGKIDDPNEQAYTYEIRALGTHLKGGKMVQKEEPEESKEADAMSATLKKTGTVAPGKKGKGDEKVEAEEISPEEEERKRKEYEEREKLNQKLQEQWN